MNDGTGSMITVRHRSLIADRWPDQQQLSVRGPQFQDDGFPEARVRHAVQEHHPAILGTPFAPSRPGDVHDFVAAQAALGRHCERPSSGLDRENAALRTRRIFESAEGEKEDGADDDPRRVEPPEHAAIIRAVTRGEIEEKLIAIIRQEKNIADDLLRVETPLADAGIDSLDALTILFAIEEQFKISVPDDEARAMKTFGDLVDIVAKRVPGETP